MEPDFCVDSTLYRESDCEYSYMQEGRLLHLSDTSALKGEQRGARGRLKLDRMRSSLAGSGGPPYKPYVHSVLNLYKESLLGRMGRQNDWSDVDTAEKDRIALRALHLADESSAGQSQRHHGGRVVVDMRDGQEVSLREQSSSVHKFQNDDWRIATGNREGAKTCDSVDERMKEDAFGNGPRDIETGREMM